MLKTKRLILKPYEDSDETAMIELLTNKTIKESYIIPEFITKADTVSYFKKLQRYSRDPHHYELGIYLQNELIGFVNDVSIDEKIIEIGYVIHPNHHNKGYATEMLTAVINDLFQKDFQTILTCAFEFNSASFRVMEKCGMSRLNQTTDILFHDKIYQCIYYSINA